MANVESGDPILLPGNSKDLIQRRLSGMVTIRPGSERQVMSHVLVTPVADTRATTGSTTTRVPWVSGVYVFIAVEMLACAYLPNRGHLHNQGCETKGGSMCSMSFALQSFDYPPQGRTTSTIVVMKRRLAVLIHGSWERVIDSLSIIRDLANQLAQVRCLFAYSKT